MNARIRSTALLTVAGLTLAAADPAAAGLYPPAAPPGSAFIRVFNATTQGKVAASVGAKTLGETPALEAGDYVFLAPGDYPVKIGNAAKTVSLQAAHCYTAALENDGVHLFDQDCFNSQLKSMIAMFNLVDGQTLSLRTADGATPVIDAVAPEASGDREVNPVKVDLAVYTGSTKLADTKPVNLERGKVFSLFVTGNSSKPMLIWAVN